MPAASIRSIRGATRCWASAPGRRSPTLPEVPEHAYIVASTDATMEAIEECGRLGVPVVTALANGFSETGAEGTAREARIRRDPQGLRHAPGRAVEPRRRRPAAQDVPHRQRRVRRAGPAGRPHLRRLAFRRHDRHVPVARQGARHPLRRARLGRQRGRSFDRRDLRSDARRSRHRRLRAVPRNHAQGARRCAPSRWKPRSAASRCWPTSSAARPRRASLRCRTPARWPARTTSPACSSPNAASPASTRWKG